MKRLIALFLAIPLLFILSALAETHEHQWRERGRKDATCSAEGSVTYFCVCGEKKTESIPRTKHKWGKWKIVREATCTKQGEQTRKCSVCGKKETRSIDTLPHTWGEWTVTAEPTDHSAGKQRHTCAVCGRQETETVDPEGTLRRGDYGEGVRHLQESLICYGALKQGGADGSFGRATEEAVKRVQQAKALTVDGVAWPQVQSIIGHVFGEWKILSPLTRTDDGVRERVCQRCGMVERDEIMALPRYQRGDRGKSIECIQQIITDIGYKPGSIDGVYGPRLDAAIAEWARDHEWYYVPGLLRPADVDELVDHWLSPEEDRIRVSGDNTPVNLQLTLTPSWQWDSGYTGEKATINWTIANLGSQDCTLGPVMYAFGENNTLKNVKKQFRFVASVDGNLLKAGGANTITGSIEFILDKSMFIADEDLSSPERGFLYLNVWALGTSREDGRKWYSNTATWQTYVFDDRLTVDPALRLSGSVIDQKAWYTREEMLEFDAVLSNDTGEDLTDVHFDIIRIEPEGSMDVAAEYIGDLPAGETWHGTFPHTMSEHDVHKAWPYSIYYYEASAKKPDGTAISAERFPLTVNTKMPEEVQKGGLSLTVEQTSVIKKSYAIGDKVTFRWTLTNDAPTDRTLTRFSQSWRDGSLFIVCADPLVIPANGAKSLSDEWSVTLEEKRLIDDAWHVIFDAYATDGEQTTHSNVVHFGLPRK